MKNKYEIFIKEKIEDMSKCSKVLDIGGGGRFQKWLAPYKNLFVKCDYKTMDYDDRTGADIIGDIHSIPLPDESVEGIICHSVLEHIENPFKATEEMRRILVPGGKIFLHVPSVYPYHARKGSYPDYWRFFDDTILLLLKNFHNIEIVKRGGYFKAMFFFVPMQHKLQWILSPLALFLDSLLNTEKRHTTSGYYIYAIK